jgi:hypothetical protein
MAFASRAVCLIVLTLAICGQAVAARPTPLTGPSSLAQTIVQTFKELSSLSNTLQSTAESVTVYNAGWRGYKISGAFGAISDRVDRAITQLERAATNDKETLNDDDAKLVVAALAKFVQVHSTALDAVIDKHGLVTLVPYVEGIRQALLNLEQNIDDFAYEVADRIPTQAKAANEQFGMLGVKLHECIATYEEPLLNAAAAAFANQ